MVGSYYCFDIPAALKSQIDDYTGNRDDYEFYFNLMYTLYAAPNVILPFFGGYLVDRFGVTICLLIFSSLIATGQVIFAIGISAKSWPIIFLGRLVFGFGGESFTVANSALLADWFKGKELAFAFGINLSISKLGSVINNIVSPALANEVSITFAFWFGAILCGFGVVCVLITMPIDRAMDEQIAKAKKQRGKSVDDEAKEKMKRDSEMQQEEQGGGLREVLTLKHIFWVLVISCVVVYGCVLPFNNISSSLLLERDYFKEPDSSCQLMDPLQCQSPSNPPVNCPSSKWYQPPIPLNYTDSNGQIYPLSTSDIDCTDDFWKDGCTSEYCSRLTDAQAKASVIMSIPYIISAALSPPLGFAVDLFGFRAVIATLAPGVLVIVHSFLGLTSVDPVGPLVGQGLAYTGFVSVLWPAVPLVVEERLTGLAFGVVTSMQNLACAVIPLVVASIYSDSNDKYIPNVEMLFVGLACVGIVVGLYMNFYDVRHDGLLNKPFQPAIVEAIDDTPFVNPLQNQEGDSFKEDDLPRDRYMSRNGSFSHRRLSGARGGSFSAYEEIARGGAYRVSRDIR